MERSDAALILSEYETGAALAKVALRLGRERLLCGNVGTAQLPVATRTEIGEAMKKIMADFRKLWLVRNRPGGLEDSVARMAPVLDALCQKP